MFKKIFVLLFILLSVSANGMDRKIHHDINAKIYPEQSKIDVTDKITINDLSNEKYEFTINSVLKIASEKFIKLVDENVNGADVGMDKDDAMSESNVKLNRYQVIIPNNTKGKFTFTINYSGRIESPLKQSKENYARGFSESAGIIWAKGVYLAGSTYWVPNFDDELVSFNLTTTAPKEWKTVSVGERTINKIENNLHIDRWDSPTPQEEVFLIAAPFYEYSYPMGAVTAYAFLRTPDEGLANKYLEATARYMEMDRKMIGPYPYTKFALVENFWETGYGMPSFTLLGEKIIRFPFILHSSYPHELLHNWWGNSVYVDFDKGNWCEGITAYMADHLIKEQRGKGEEYRRATLQKFTNYVTKENDFPISNFLSRYDAASEAIGYGKTLMVNHMLRRKVGDENFLKAYRLFNRNNKFKRASFDDIRSAFEEVTGEKLKWFFEQWIQRTGAPQLVLENVEVKSVRDFYSTSFTLKQIQDDAVFYLDVPVALVTKSRVETKVFQMNEKKSHYNFTSSEKPLEILIDPQFDMFRKLDPRETPPTFTKGFGAKKTLVVLPGDSKEFELYKSFADQWIKGKEEKLIVKEDKDISKLPDDLDIFLLGKGNKFLPDFNNQIKDYDSEISKKGVRFSKQELSDADNSFFICAVNPKNNNHVITYLSIGNKDAVDGLVRKLPHYGKYSYLAFAGSEPSNIAKGEWAVNNSPLMKVLDKSVADNKIVLEKREPLAQMAPVFSAKRMMETIKFLASDKLQGRGIGTNEINKASDYIAAKFKEYGLKPGSDDGTYFQSWTQDVLDKKDVSLKNVIGIIPGTNPNLSEAVVITAHYDHLGLGWPDAKKGNEGKIHNGADDNASGIAVMLELAKTLGKTAKPARTIIFVAFTAEEAGLVGSRYFVENYKKFPSNQILADINLDTVGRLFGHKLMVLNSNSAREWKFIFMGTDFTTGVASDLVTQDLDASDQVAFIEKGIPAVQLFYVGPGSDYHVPEDDVEKIDSDGLVKVATVAREVLEYLAERDEPMHFTGSSKHGVPPVKMKGKGKNERRVATGSMPDFAFTGTGVRIADVLEDSPAAKGGLKVGDIIVGMNDKTIANLKDYTVLLKEHKPGDKVTLKILRGEKTKMIDIILGER